jgi:putative endopeptidase
MFNHQRLCLIAVMSGLSLYGLTGCKSENPPAYTDPIDLSARDSSVRPQDDFFDYANGGWIRKTVIPAAQSSWGAIFSLSDQSLANMRDILDSLSKVPGLQKGTVEQQVADLYGSLMDSAGIESKGLNPLREDLVRIAAIKDVRGVLDGSGPF